MTHTSFTYEHRQKSWPSYPGSWYLEPPPANCSTAKLLTVYIIYKHTQYISILTRLTTHILYVPLCNFTCITRLPANYSYDNNDYTLHNVRKHSCASVYLTTNTNLLKAWVERFTRSSSFCGLSLTQASVVVPSKVIQAQVCSTRVRETNPQSRPELSRNLRKPPAVGSPAHLPIHPLNQLIEAAALSSIDGR